MLSTQDQNKVNLPTLSTFTQHCGRRAIQCNEAEKKRKGKRREEKRKGTQIQNEELKLFLLVEDMLVYIENLKESKEKNFKN